MSARPPLLADIDIDITTEDELRAIGAAAAYRWLKHVNPRGVSLNMLWALAGAVEDRDWRSFSADEKAALKRAAGLEA